jgi:hypothetical protein
MVSGPLVRAGKISDIERNVNRSPGRRHPSAGTLSVNAAAKNSNHLNPGGHVMKRQSLCTVAAFARELHTTFAKR